MKRRFPKNVSEYEDRHGKFRLRFRKAGVKTYYFQHPYPSAEFEVELKACRAGDIPKVEPGADKIVPDTIADLITRYYRSQDFGSASAVTQSKNRGILEMFRAAHGSKMVRSITFEHLDAIFAAKAKQHPAAAKNLRKQLRRLFRHAVRIGMRPNNPVDLTGSLKGKKTQHGHKAWSEVHIAQFRDAYPLGTTPRLALEMLLWTDQRKGDVIELGPKDILDGRFVIEQEKTGKIIEVKVAPQLLAAIKAMQVVGADTFLITQYGKPFSSAGFGNRFRTWCDKAGLHGLSAHGIRKAGARRAADIGASNQQLKSLGGWSDDREVAGYVASANQRALADKTIDAVSAWELANQQPDNWLTEEKTAERRD